MDVSRHHPGCGGSDLERKLGLWNLGCHLKRSSSHS